MEPGEPVKPRSGILHKDVVMAVLNAALRAADPYQAVRKALESCPDVLTALNQTQGGKTWVIGAGKAGAAMAHAAQDMLGERITDGLVIVPSTEYRVPSTEWGAYVLGTRYSVLGTRYLVRVREARHPVPDSRGAEATLELLKIAEAAGEGDLVVCLISGGGSALLTAPAEGVGLEDVQVVTGLLLRAGATINELNAVRKRLSRVSGGQLARIAAPGRVLSLILSDVTGSPLDVIASGPTAPDPTTYVDALEVLARYEIMDQTPGCVVDRLHKGRAGLLAETPKPGDPIFDSVTNVLIASNVIAVEAAAARARELGLNTAIVSTYVEGEAREVGKMLAAVAKEVAAYGRPVPRPACLLFGGETTVTVRGNGIGGRNSELALSAAIALEGLGPDLVVASLATDGGDGPSPGAGGIVDGATIKPLRGNASFDRAMAVDQDLHAARAYLANNDSYTFLAKLGDAIMTGPTGTNVNDVMAVFVF